MVDCLEVKVLRALVGSHRSVLEQSRSAPGTWRTQRTQTTGTPGMQRIVQAWLDSGRDSLRAARELNVSYAYVQEHLRQAGYIE